MTQQQYERDFVPSSAPRRSKLMWAFGCLVVLFFVLPLLLLSALENSRREERIAEIVENMELPSDASEILGQPFEEFEDIQRPAEVDQPVVDAEPPFDPDGLGPPVWGVALFERGDEIIRELVITLPPGSGDLRFVMQGSVPVESGSQGIALRTDTWARSLTSAHLEYVDRPRDCPEGCDVVVWLTLGREFEANHPDAVLVLYADEGTLAVMEGHTRYPSDMYR